MTIWIEPFEKYSQQISETFLAPWHGRGKIGKARLKFSMINAYAILYTIYKKWIINTCRIYQNHMPPHLRKVIGDICETLPGISMMMCQHTRALTYVWPVMAIRIIWISYMRTILQVLVDLSIHVSQYKSHKLHTKTNSYYTKSVYAFQETWIWLLTASVSAFMYVVGVWNACA